MSRIWGSVEENEISSSPSIADTADRVDSTAGSPCELIQILDISLTADSHCGRLSEVEMVERRVDKLGFKGLSLGATGRTAVLFGSSLRQVKNRRE